MELRMRSVWVGIALCVLLPACNGAGRNTQTDLYALSPAGAAPVDNDSYYTPPKRSSLCGSDGIGESPSCGGI